MESPLQSVTYVGLPNIVHLYAKLDVERPHDILRNNLDDFDRFEDDIVRYVKRTG